MERLKGRATYLRLLLRQHLHSSMERLKGGLEAAARLSWWRFTFQYGEIKSPAQFWHRRHLTDLHSSMERLKVIRSALSSIALSWFTFQYGEIKSLQHPCYAPITQTFTFQYGEIKSFQFSAYVSTTRTFTFQYGEIKSAQTTAERNPHHAIYIPVWRD